MFVNRSVSGAVNALLHYGKGIDWKLMIILFIISNQAVITLKVAGLLLLFILRPQFRFNIFKQRLPLFYPVICILAVVNQLVYIQDYSKNYLVAFGVAIAYWAACFFCSHQLKLSIERRGQNVVHRSLQVFAFLNAAASIFQIARISLSAGKLNPYVGLPFPYGMSTGDNIYGAFMQLSYCNMIVSAMLCVYFLFRRDIWCSLASCISLMLVFGNVGNIVFAVVILTLFVLSIIAQILPGHFLISKTLRRLTPPIGSRKIFAVFALLFLLFYGLISIENLKYTRIKLAEKMAQAGKPQTVNQRREAALATDRFRQLNFRQYIQKPYVKDTLDYRRRLTLTKLACAELSGKRLSLRETKAYLKLNMPTALLGAGPVRFSSLTAARMSGLDSSRIFARLLPGFSTPAYHDNHRLLNVVRISAPESEYSNSNWPDTFYNQLLGEYGLLGTATFLIFYVWFFLKHFRRMTYGIWLSVMLVPFALLSYLFEPLCVMLFFELLMFLDITKGTPERTTAHE